MSENGSRPDKDLELSALFDQKEREIREAEAKNRLARAEYEARKRAEERMGASVTRALKTSSTGLGAPLDSSEFSDTERSTYERLSPEVKLTTVEDVYEGVSDDAPTHYYESPDSVEEGADYTRNASLEDPSYNKPYDYDYEAQEEEEPVSYAPRVRPQRGQASRRQVETDDLLDDIALMESENEDPEGRRRRIALLVIAGLIGLIILVMLGIIIFGNRNGRGESGSGNSSVQEDLQRFTGVIADIDLTTRQVVGSDGGALYVQTITVYNYESGQQRSFPVEMSASAPVSLNDFDMGDVVEIQYDAASGDLVRSMIIPAKVSVIRGVQGVSFGADQVNIGSAVYSIDEHLVCLYQGRPFDVGKISEDATFSIVVYDNKHIYAVLLESATGELLLQNAADYEGASLKATPANGEAVESAISGEEIKVELPEGAVDLVITKDGEVVYTAQTFISAGEVTKLQLPAMEVKKGKIVFEAELEGQSDKPKLTIDEKEYSLGEEIELEYGDYILTLEPKGYQKLEQKITVSQPYAQVRLTLRKLEAEVTFTLKFPEGSSGEASLYIDGTFSGMVSPSTTKKLAVGSHEISIFADGFVPVKKTVEVTQDTSAMTVEIPMEKEAIMVSFASNQMGTIIMVTRDDGTYVTGEITSLSLELPFEKGSYTVTASKEGYHLVAQSQGSFVIDDTTQDNSIRIDFEMAINETPEESSSGDSSGTDSSSGDSDLGSESTSGGGE